jgi:preprotein translocase subunit SecE
MTFGEYFLIISAIVCAWLLLSHRVRILKFIAEVKAELDKCAWPWDPNQTGFKRYKELIESTMVVIISVILLAGFVTTSDVVLAHVVGALTGGGIANATVSAPALPNS